MHFYGSFFWTTRGFRPKGTYIRIIYRQSHVLDFSGLNLKRFQMNMNFDLDG